MSATQFEEKLNKTFVRWCSWRSAIIIIMSCAIDEGTYIIENVETERYLFQDGEKIKGNRGDEGGWLASSGFQAPPVLGADANYYNRAYWKIIPQGDDRYFVENVETKRYLFQDGEKIKGEWGDEGGWLASSGFQAPPVLRADANYYNRATGRSFHKAMASTFLKIMQGPRSKFSSGGAKEECDKENLGGGACLWISIQFL